MKPEPKHYNIPSGKWRKQYPCRKNKGDHTYVLWYARPITILKDLFDADYTLYYTCTACGKHRVEYY